MNNIPNKILEATQEVWGLDGTAIVVYDIGYDWVISKKRDFVAAGALRLIVPKGKGGWFLIPSNSAANDESGVSYEYEIILESFNTNNVEIVKIFAKHIDINALNLLKLMKDNKNLGIHYIGQPLRLLNDLGEVNCSITLNRIDDKGGYCYSESDNI